MALYQKMFLKISIISVPKIVLLSSKAQFSSDLHLSARLKVEKTQFPDGLRFKIYMYVQGRGVWNFAKFALRFPRPNKRKLVLLIPE